MTNDARWDLQYKNVMQFMEKTKGRPSKHKADELQMFNWIKFNKKRLRRGLMPEHRRERFQILLDKAVALQRINQYLYVNNELNGED